MNWDQRFGRKQPKKHTKSDQKILKKIPDIKLNISAVKIQKIDREALFTSIRSPTTYFNNTNDATSLQLHYVTHVTLRN